ncbi:signal peptidase II [Photobacterium piscicola]|uniref:Lipoprotein signal peptidase n=1 Tax=Photobacterium piscicola TaxID=1378299 RepID=A0ABU6LHR3_9GAMM|nr:signal peptidase II [Photobacterium piscicola]MEC6899100.1 signal peptidase II [Photobacterium piscicola]MEC6908230.1 signal peptidase II [Photobacterium piscicola]
MSNVKLHSKFDQRSGLRWLWLAIIIFMIDYLSKVFIIGTMTVNGSTPITVLPFMNLYYVHNTGAAFSFLSTEGGWQRWLLALIAVVACGFLSYKMRQASITQTAHNIGCAFIIGGALGNLFDRIQYGFVIDFLDFHYKNHHFAIFNLADVAIFCGVILYLLSSLKKTS